MDADKMNTGISANKLELLQIADAVAREKSIEPAIVLDAMADAIQKAAKARYGSESDIRADIDPQTGDTNLRRVMLVVENVENENTELTLEEARRIKPDAEIGEELSEALP
ncbi:MAG: transcription termination/antitermination protein NusA, partial [Alphaproteobacteria bacterium]|nr:transcription termination/antitermination protein NusA [Alphaproteobacteria bacterium]